MADRWSIHLARPPGFLSGAEPQVVQWFHDNVYDRADLDDEATIQSLVTSYRAEAARLGIRGDESDGPAAIAYARLQLGLTNWAQIAGSAGSVAPSGTNALPAPLLDVVGAYVEQQIAPARNAEIAAGQYLGDDVRLVAAAGLNNSTAAEAIIGHDVPSYLAVRNPDTTRPPGGVPMPGQQDAYGQVTTSGIEGTRTAPSAALSGPPSSLGGGYANAPVSTSAPLTALVSGLNPYYVAAGVVLLYLWMKGQK
jgi:hypothetical protein